MSPNLTTSYTAIQIERSELDRRASRGWQAEEAVQPHARTPMISTFLTRVGTMLVSAGEQLQGSSGTFAAHQDAREPGLPDTQRSPARGHA